MGWDRVGRDGDRVGWDGREWDRGQWDGVGWDGIGWDRMGWVRITRNGDVWNGMEWDRMGWNGTGRYTHDICFSQFSYFSHSSHFFSHSFVRRELSNVGGVMYYNRRASPRKSRAGSSVRLV